MKIIDSYCIKSCFVFCKWKIENNDLICKNNESIDADWENMSINFVNFVKIDKKSFYGRIMPIGDGLYDDYTIPKNKKNSSLRPLSCFLRRLH